LLLYLRVSNFLPYTNFTRALFKTKKKNKEAKIPKGDHCVSMPEIRFPEWHVEFACLALSILLIHPRVKCVAIPRISLRCTKGPSAPSRGAAGAGGAEPRGGAARRAGLDAGDTCCRRPRSHF